MPGPWRALSPSLSIRTLAGATPLPSEGQRLPLSDPPQGDELPSPLIARPRYLLHARETLLLGQRALIDTSDPASPTLFNDVLSLPEPFFDHATPLSRFPNEWKMTPGVSRDGETLRLDPARITTIRLDEPVIHLGSTESRNYGSWIFRIIPKLLALDDIPESRGRALLLSLEQPFMRDIVETLVPNRRSIPQDITASYNCADLLQPSLLAPSNVLPPDLVEKLRRFAASCPPPEQAAKKLYISRRGWSETVNRRVLLNEDLLAESLIARGFVELFPERLSFSARAAAFAHADIVIGPTGSAMFNAAFCKPSAKIIEIEPHGQFRAMHDALYRSLGLAFGFLRGTGVSSVSGPHEAWSIDSEAVDRLHKIIDD